MSSILAQSSYSFRHLGKNDGLSQSSVFAVAQDSTGFMWFGTRDGLNRFDGHDFKSYRADSSTSGPLGSDIRSLLYDPGARGLWVGSTDGLSLFRPETDRFEHLEEVRGAIRALHLSNAGTLYVCTSSGLYQRPADSTRLTRISLPGIELSGLNAVYVEGSSLWLGTALGLYRLRRTSTGLRQVVLPTKLAELGNFSVKTLYCSPEGVVYFGTYANGLYSFDPATERLEHYWHNADDPKSLPDDNVRALKPDGRGGIWVGTFKGLGLFDPATKTFDVVRASGMRLDELSDNSIRSLFLDARGSLWAGTYYGGVNQLDPVNERFRTFVRTPSPKLGQAQNVVEGRDFTLGADIVSSFAEDQYQNLYIGTEGGGLDYYNAASGTFSHFRHDPNDPTSISGPNVKSLLLDEQHLWIGTFSAGLNRLDIRTGKFEHFRAAAPAAEGQASSLAHDNVYTLAKRGDLLWAGTYGGGLSIFNVETEHFHNYRFGEGDSDLPSDFIREVHSSAEGVLIGSDDGLHRVILNADGLPVDYETLLAGSRVHSIYPSSDGRLWVGTLSKGMFVVGTDGSGHQQYTVADGLPGNSVFGILGDRKGRLWLSTNNGLARFDPATGNVSTYDHPSGLISGEFNYGAYLRLPCGELLFGGLQGFTWFDPEAITEDDNVAPLAFTALIHNGRQLRPGPEEVVDRSLNHIDEVTLEYNDASFAVGIAALDYVTPESGRLEYLLEGLDGKWQTARGKVLATYTIQREGNYVLRARSFNADGKPNPQELRLDIKVLPPAWRSSWAYALYGLLALGLLFVGYRFVNLRHSFQLEHLARQRDEELHEGKLRFFTNITHEFRTPLTLIVGPLNDLLANDKLDVRTRAQLQGIEKNSQKLLDLVDRVLTFRKLSSEHGRLQGSKLDINWFLRKLNEPFADEALRRNIDMRLEAGISPLYIWCDPRMLEMAITSLLSNAMKFTPEGGRLRLSAKRVLGEYFEIRVADNGRGVPDALKGQIFQRFFEGPLHESGSGSGIGLAVAKELIALHQGQITVEDTAGGGATFVILLPIGSEHFAPGLEHDAAALRELDAPPELDSAESLVVSEPSFPENSVSAPFAAGPAPTSSPEKPLLLIVEDNAELRGYLHSIFEQHYRVKVAADGAEGLALASRNPSPDLIVSDVMMPNMDGQELCKRLKTNVETSHIPVILLTAKTSELATLEGLRLGADDYITKPFLPEELLLRVRNTLATREQVRQSFGRVVNLEPREISVTSADEEFLINAMAYVEDGIDDPSLNVNQMAQQLNVSRALLFTKVKALTGQTPSNFVKTIRLRRAAQLLATGKLNVSEVAYRVGFRDPKYFGKCFKQQYGVTASGYAEKQPEDASS